MSIKLDTDFEYCSNQEYLDNYNTNCWKVAGTVAVILVGLGLMAVSITLQHGWGQWKDLIVNQLKNFESMGVVVGCAGLVTALWLTYNYLENKENEQEGQKDIEKHEAASQNEVLLETNHAEAMKGTKKFKIGLIIGLVAVVLALGLGIGLTQNTNHSLFNMIREKAPEILTYSGLAIGLSAIPYLIKKSMDVDRGRKLRQKATEIYANFSKRFAHY